jgi:hypothetical protein
MNTKPTITDLVTQNPQIANSVKKMERVKQALEEEANKAMMIVVKDPLSLSIAEQSLTKLNDLVKAVEVERVEGNKPILAAQRGLNAVAAYIVEAPEKAMKHLKEEKTVWILRCEALQKKVDNLSAWCQQRLEKSETVEHCNPVIEKLETCPGEEVYFEYYSQVKVIVDNYTKLFKLKKTEIEMLEDATPDEVESIQETIAEAKEAIVEAQEVVIHTPVKKTRRPFIFEVVNLDEVPREFLMIDEKKVKEWMKNNPDKLVDGKVINGIKYKQDLRVTV